MTDDTQVIEVPPHVLDYLAKHGALTLATASSTGIPRATTLTYVNDGLSFYVWTQPDSVVARHVAQNPVVSFAVDDYAEDWRETRGVQATGECRVLLNPDEIERAVALFQQKFPSLAAGAVSNISLFRITPSSLQFIEGAAEGGDGDQTLGLEYRREVAFNVFHHLPAESVTSVEAQLQQVKVEPGEVIVRQGGPADKFFIIVDGKVEAIREDDGEERLLAELGRGQFFGEVAILHDSPRTATVRAVEPTTLLAMERETFQSLIAQSLGTTQDFDRIVKDRMYRLVAGGR